MDPQKLQQLFGLMVDVGVVTVGDLMIDRYIHGEVTRVSPEAPIPVLAKSSESVMLGGCGNVARNVAALGGRVALLGVVGNDAAAGEAHRLLGLEDRVANHLVHDAARRTTLKTRYVSAGQQLLRVDDESTHPLTGAAEDALVDAIGAAAAGAGAILISDYGKGVVTHGILRACLAAAARGAVVVVDSKARGLAHYGAVDVIKPNAQELASATGLPTVTDAQIETALSAALAMCEAGAVLATRAAKGMSLAVRGETVRHYSRPPPEVFDTAGAGDTALAALGLGLAAGMDIHDAVELSLLASSLVVQKAGTATVSPDEILEWESASRRPGSDAKLATPARMTREAERWRARGMRVGFTNGCFDILHAGHIAYLTQARSWCDRLIVGLNTDESIRALKGAGRPVNGLDSRAKVLAGLTCVDLVVPFAEETPVALITAARPDVLIKGADYTLDRVVGRDLVLGWGGEVRLASFVEGHSTTSTIQRIAADL